MGNSRNLRATEGGPEWDSGDLKLGTLTAGPHLHIRVIIAQISCGVSKLIGARFDFRVARVRKGTSFSPLPGRGYHRGAALGLGAVGPQSSPGRLAQGALSLVLSIGISAASVPPTAILPRLRLPLDRSHWWPPTHCSCSRALPLVKVPELDHQILAVSSSTPTEWQRTLVDWASGPTRSARTSITILVPQLGSLSGVLSTVLTTQRDFILGFSWNQLRFSIRQQS